MYSLLLATIFSNTAIDPYHDPTLSVHPCVRVSLIAPPSFIHWAAREAIHKALTLNHPNNGRKQKLLSFIIYMGPFIQFRMSDAWDDDEKRQPTLVSLCHTTFRISTNLHHRHKATFGFDLTLLLLFLYNYYYCYQFNNKHGPKDQKNIYTNKQRTLSLTVFESWCST